MRFDTIIVGAGIAGASAALQLSRHQKVLLVETKQPAAGASGVAGGLFSPMIALRGRPVWHIDAAIKAFNDQIELAGAKHLFDNRGVLRPAKDEQQVEFFKQSAEMCPEHAEWWPADQSKEKFPFIEAPLGSLFAKTGGAFSTTLFTQMMVEAAVKQGTIFLDNTHVIGWGFANQTATITINEADAARHEAVLSNVQLPTGGIQPMLHPPDKIHLVNIKADRVLLALGKAFLNWPVHQLDLHGVKGQTIRIKRPDWLKQEDLPPTSSQAYIIPEKDTLAIGSSFEHTYSDEKPSRAVSKQLLNKVVGLLPGLAGEKIIEEHVGIRVTVPKIRLPMVGPYGKGSRLWVFTGFGSKGLLLAPLLASRLHEFFDEPALIPQEIQVRVKS